ncbi:squalene/phytoene synthase family protein [Paracoccus sp. (in: a-proteobacteria)]|uniref:squalene/phytoene synthase family protein n=1 Tax=Paracoccus sp. TaxID=267 RepID=UPI0026DEF87F|nr:squalene/phytoene synthase family protein [Paracoccus sp. (in: a-proteobacteria)]MDO5646796.1 squalene/phytoene synthase family protein [Paracoccus sp. (in: a-proteobacteria)]
MTLDICTDRLRSDDPDRFGAVLTARPDDRAALVTLYALNLEIARAPFQSAEPMLSEIRLQWWADRLEEMGRGVAPPLHDVLTPLWEAWGDGAGQMVPLAHARHRDCERQPFKNVDQVIEYVYKTASSLMSLAARRCGAPDSTAEAVAQQARGAGLTAWLRALPQLQAMGLGLDGAPDDAPRELASHARDAFRAASHLRRKIPASAAAALYPGPRVSRLLSEIAAGRVDAYQDTPQVTPFQRRASLARLAMTGRWWR